MIRILFFCLLVFFTHSVAGQIRLESQAGGANFLGMTINVAAEKRLSESGNISIEPNLGFGMLLPGWDNPTDILHAAVNLKFDRFGFGTEGSWFMKSLFVKPDPNQYSDFVSLILYPNLNYRIIDRTTWYLRVSAGAYFAFDKGAKSPYSDQWTFGFAGDVMPGAGVNLGYKFKKHNRKMKNEALCRFVWVN